MDDLAGLEELFPRAKDVPAKREGMLLRLSHDGHPGGPPAAPAWTQPGCCYCGDSILNPRHYTELFANTTQCTNK